MANQSAKDDPLAFHREHQRHEYENDYNRIRQTYALKFKGQPEVVIDYAARIAVAEKFREGRKNAYDSLTGLYGKVEFTKRVMTSMDFVGRRSGVLDVIFLDVDNFKLVNDKLGHAKGDEVLRKVAQILNSCIRPYDTASRLSGDEFALLFFNGEQDFVTSFFQRVENMREEMAKTDAGMRLISFSMGSAKYDGKEPIDEKELLHRADTAMYNAKMKKGTQLVHWKKGMTQPVKTKKR